MPLLPDFLHPLEYVHLDDRFMVAREYRPIFLGIIPGFLIPDGIGVGLEIDRAPRVFRHLKNMYDLRAVPVAGILRDGIGHADPQFSLVCRRCQYLFRYELIRNLAGASAFHAQAEDMPDDLSGLGINDPMLWIRRVLHVPIGHIGGQRYALFAFCLVDRTNLPAGVAGEEFVEPVADTGKVVVHAHLIR